MMVIHQYQVGFFGDPEDFQSPCASLLEAKYSDISDDEFDIPVSQKHVGQEIGRKTCDR